MGGTVTTTGTGLTELNATGGGNGIGTNNNGLHFAANYSAPDIIAEKQTADLARAATLRTAIRRLCRIRNHVRGYGRESNLADRIEPRHWKF